MESFKAQRCSYCNSNFFLSYVTFPLLVDYWKTKLILCLNDKIAQSDVFARILYTFFFLLYFVRSFSHAHFPSGAASDPDIPGGSTGKNARCL